ncbi:glycosyltransferase [Lacinutrix chionoecetis]
MKKKILIAPLHWGIGHATRCIPIINWLIDSDFEPIIASDGAALLILQKEFPELKCIELPAFNITYQKTGSHLKLKLLTQLPHIIKTYKAERKAIQHIVKNYAIDGIISDSRFGIYCKTIPSVIITHQLNVLSGNTSYLSSKLNQIQLKNYDQIWVPDFKSDTNLSGALGHLSNNKRLKVKYIGPLSRLTKTKVEPNYDLMVLLSGPEPQRTLLEQKLFDELKNYNGTILFVKGVIENIQTCVTKNQFTIYNFMTSETLEKAINSSKLIISRSGYTTVMDLAALGKKALFIPTPGQFEQEYLAKRFTELQLAYFCTQEDFKLSEIEKAKRFKGLNINNRKPDIKELFSLF